MGERVDVSTFANSQCAIREYMHFKLENEYMHEARVLVSSMGKTRYNDILKVVPRIETNNSSIDIIGDAQFELDYYGRRKVEELRREFYINCCVVLDKSHPKNKKKICEDKLIEAIYYERDKNCAHRDDDYKSPEFNQLSDMIETMKHQIQKVLVVCRDSLPSNITLDFVSHDKELFRLIYGITAEKEEEIKHKKYPEYGKTPQS